MKNHIEVNATARKTGELRYWETYDQFIKDYRFFMCSGEVSQFVESDENHFNKIVEFLTTTNEEGLTVTTTRAGLNISFTYTKEFGLK